ncbi:helix-turn-helix domain-containing protein [Defluviimonas sp. D31]|uniref:AraC family transcriptional regulator n=1 Tax=Defluviimonas sp. D31 TaxID=3083253 RepID=UPI00296F1D21|nr:helix-turn-helix domain-containing protein [Defluviimonas sp. D31]MDW4551605.1 helix-turn-helix domain-containing protein [Defluviimonas sp. D31]
MIPLVRARYSAHFVDALRATGLSEGSVMDRAGLSDDVLERADGVTTIWQLGEVARHCAVRTGNLDIGWTAAASAALDGYGQFSEHVLSSQSLATRLSAFCRAANDEYSEASFYIERRRNTLLFKRGPIAGDEISARQTELYVVFMMLSTIRSVLGHAWQPMQVWLQTFHRKETEALFDVGKTDLRFEHPETVITIHVDDMVRSLETDGQRDAGGDFRSLSLDTASALTKLIDGYLGDQHISLAFMARICDVQPRALQRLLARENKTFGELLAQRRTAAAVEHLKSPDMKIADVSYCLGYAHQAHFCRAFRRQTGLTPSEYRRAVQES